MKYSAIAALAFSCVLATSRFSSAQNAVPRYQPSRPTVSPYLNLLRNDSGAIPNYYSLVRPQQQQIATNQQQQIELTRQRQQLESLNNNLLRVQEPTIRATGIGSGFQDYSHFFPRAAPAARRR